MISVVLEGEERAARFFEGIGHQATHLRPAMDEGIRELELGHAIKFGRMGGKYVDTGRFRASLTADSPDAIRSTDDGGLTFGSAVPYARYLPPILIRKGKPFELIAEAVAKHLVSGDRWL